MKQFYRRNKAEDWHPADIIAALRKAGWSLRRLSQAHGRCPHTLGAALQRPYFAGELIIAQTLGLSPAQIWPSRYPRCGNRRSTKRESVCIGSIKEHSSE
ncbi:MAG: helix-turn-helix transcriptional regulator [Candidatus Competibacteraceae bacterium]